MSGFYSEVFWTVLLTFTPAMSGYPWVEKPDILTPIFDDFTIRDIEATKGQTVLLPCTVRYLGDKVVSWIRSRDLHILTSGPHAFSSDSRFEPVPSGGGDFWGLRIRGVDYSDKGQYECQVNTDPKMSLAFNLTVVGNPVASNSKWLGQALIKGPKEVYAQDDSQVTFACEISPLSVESPQSGESGVFIIGKPKVRWLHDNKELLTEALDSRYLIKTAYNERTRTVIGSLQISEVSRRDSGQYTCLQMSVKADSVKLFVVETEHSEAMQRDFPTISSGNQILFQIGLITLIVFNFPP